MEDQRKRKRNPVRRARKFAVLEPMGLQGGEMTFEIAETRGGRLLVFESVKVARAVASELCGKVEGFTIESSQTRGRKADPRMLAALCESELAAPDKKPSPKELAKKHFGPFEKTIRGQRALTKKSDSLERSIRHIRRKAGWPAQTKVKKSRSK